MYVYGPVPSRRLGHSMGINNIPPKVCTYSCVYCQLGKTNSEKVIRKIFYNPDEIYKAVKKKLKLVRENNEHVDFLTFVPDGEPTLDINLGKEIAMLKDLGIKVAVITNASLLWNENVIEDLTMADLVSLKIDAISPNIWRKVNRPHGLLKHDIMKKGIVDFAHVYFGELMTETMLIDDINDHSKELNRIAKFIKRLNPQKSYLSIPTRPPAVKGVKPSTESNLNEAFQIFRNIGINVEYLIGFEGNDFSLAGEIEANLLDITAVHPMREDSVREYLRKGKKDWGLIEELVRQNKLVETKYKGMNYYLRKYPNQCM